MPVVLTAPFAQAAFDHLDNLWIGERCERLVRRQQETPGRRQDRGLPDRTASRASLIALGTQAEDAVGRHAEQGSQLGDDRRGEDLQPLFGIETADSGDDEFKSAATRFQPPDLLVRANRRGDRQNNLPRVSSVLVL